MGMGEGRTPGWSTIFYGSGEILLDGRRLEHRPLPASGKGAGEKGSISDWRDKRMSRGVNG